MIDWLLEYWNSLTSAAILGYIVVFLITFSLSILIVGIVVVRIPPAYFSSHYQRDFLPNSSWITRWGAVIAKNVVGAVLVVAGVIMLIGPGQGVLTILIGLIMLDIPGKRPLEARIIKRPAVLSAINRLREKYGKEPLEVD